MANVKNMKEILYIHGYNSSGSTGNFLEDYFGKQGIKVYHPKFSPDYALARLQIDDFLNEHQNIDLVIGSSLGGCMALDTKNIPRIVINPCMHPEVELKKLDKAGETFGATYCPKYERNNYDLKNVWGIFGTADELIDYRDEFSQIFDYNKMFFVKDGKHSLTNEQLANALDRIFNK